MSTTVDPSTSTWTPLDGTPQPEPESQGGNGSGPAEEIPEISDEDFDAELEEIIRLAESQSAQSLIAETRTDPGAPFTASSIDLLREMRVYDVPEWHRTRAAFAKLKVPLRELDAATKPIETERETREPQAPPCTDVGNAERLVRDHGEDLRHVQAWGWLAHDGTRYRRDDTGEATRRAVLTVRNLYRTAADIDEPQIRQAIAEHARKSEHANRIRAMLTLAQSQAAVVARPEDFDRDPFLFNVVNGGVDLRTGELRPHRREDMVTKLAPVHYDASATCPRFDSFLARIMDNNKELIGFLQRAAGYSLTGIIRDRRVLFLCYGTGANGKSRYMTALRGVVGDYGQQAPVSLFLQKSGDAVPTDLARLAGARLVTCSEAPRERQGAEEVLKALGGGEPVAARFMRRDYFEFTPCAKFWWGVNDRPRLRDDDSALWDRVLQVPFDVTIPPSERKPEHVLDAELAAERPGILRWMIEGCRAWQRDGLQPPAQVTEATEAYRRDQNPIQNFIDEHCLLGAGKSVPSSDLRRAYDAWAEANGVKYTLGPRKFADRLKALDVKPDKGAKGVRVWRGIGLLDENRDDESRDQEAPATPELPLKDRA